MSGLTNAMDTTIELSVRYRIYYLYIKNNYDLFLNYTITHKNVFIVKNKNHQLTILFLFVTVELMS